MAKIALTQKRIEKLLQLGPGRYRDTEVRGLLLVIVESKRKPIEDEDEKQLRTTASWQLRYQLHGRERWLGLGSIADVSLTGSVLRALS